MTTAVKTKTSLPRRMVLAMMVASAAVVSAGAPKAQAAGDLVDLEVIDRETGQAARVWRHAGRLFVAGRPGARYSLRLTNNTGGRVLAVMSVDGVNILTGETAGYGQRGYVFGPYQSYEVSGWRKSDTEVAAFTFAPLSRSYAARTGRPDDVGVIGIAAFTERAYAPYAVGPQAEASSRDRSSAPPSAGAPPPPPPRAAAPASPSARSAPSDESALAQRRSEKLGTAHGEREWSTVTTVAFQRATTYPQLIQRIEYDSYDNLVAAGVIPRPRPQDRAPRPFPSGGGYVPDPPGRR